MSRRKIYSVEDVATILEPAVKVFQFPKFKLASEALTQAMNIIRDTRRWTQSELAVSQEISKVDGQTVVLDTESCETKAKNAVAFCALGAVEFVNGPAQRRAVAFLREAGKKVCITEKEALPDDEAGNDHIFFINDEVGHRATMRMFTLAIKAAKKAETERKQK